MPWYSRLDWKANEKLHADDVNNIGHDLRFWGGNVDGGGYTLSNVNIVAINPLAGGSGVTSFNGRNGDVMPFDNSRDYTAAMVGAVPVTRLIVAGPGITVSGIGQLSSDVTITAAVQSFNTRTGAITLTSTDVGNAGGVLRTQKLNTVLGSGLQGGGPYGSADLNLSVVPNTTNQQIQVMSQNNPIGSPRHAINFISGTGTLVTVQEISASDRIDVTVQSTGTGGFVDPTQVTGDLIVRGLTAPATRLAVGTDGQVLTADHLAAGGLGVKWAAPPATNAVTSVFGRTGAILASAADGYTAAMVANAVDQQGTYNLPPWIKSLSWNVITDRPAFMLDPTQAKGDLIVHAQTGTTRLIAGSDGSILMTDSSLPAGVKWGAVPIKSFNTRGDAVMPAGGDYTVDMIPGAVPTSRTINTTLTSGLTGGGPLEGNLSLSVVADTTNQQVQVWQEGITLIGTRKALNFKSGAGVALTIVDSPPGTGSNRIDITIASSGTGSGGGLVDPTTAKGDLIVRPSSVTPPGALPVGADGKVLTADATQQFGMRWATPAAGGAGSQTPWLGPIDAAANMLNNAGGIGVNIASDTTKARVYAFTNALEDGFQAKTGSAAGLAAASFINNAGDSLTLRSYGTGFVGGLPGLASIEASNVLAIFANAAEVMRLKSGRVLIGTTTDDGVNKLQVNGKVKSLTGGFVFPDNSIQVTAYTAASSPVTSVFGRTGAVVAATTIPYDYSAAIVTNAVDSSVTYNDPAWMNTLAWAKITGKPTTLFLDPTTTKGDIIARGAAAPATRLAVGSDGQVLTADAASTNGVKWAAGPGQTPWLSIIDGAGFGLKNAGTIQCTGGPNPTSGTGLEFTYQTGISYITSYDRTAGAYNGLSLSGAAISIASSGAPITLNPGGGNVLIGTSSSTLPNTHTALHCLIGGANSNLSELTLAANASAGGPIGLLNFANYSITAADKRVACIFSNATPVANSGDMEFYTANTGTLTERMRITATGFVGIGVSTPGYALDVSGIIRSINQPIVTPADSGFEWWMGSYSVIGPWQLTHRNMSNSAITIPFAVQANGYVAIGNQVTATSILHIAQSNSGAVGPVITLENSTGAVNDAASIKFVDSSLRAELRFSVQSNPYGGDLIYFGGGAGTTEVFRATSAGAFGINTGGALTPSGKLEVQASYADGTGIFASNRLATWGSVAAFNAYRFLVTYSAATDGNFKGIHLGAGGIGIGYNPPVYSSPAGLMVNGWVSVLTSVPQVPLHVTTGTVTIASVPAAGTYGGAAIFGLDSATYGMYIGSINNGMGYIQQQRGDSAVTYPLLLQPNGNNVGIGISPSYKLDVAGDVNSSGIYRMAGGAFAVIRTQYNVTASRALNTVYQNNNPFPIFVSVYAIVNSGSYIKLLSDGGNPPSTTIFAATNTYTNTAGYSAAGFVMQGHFYKIDTPGASLTTWVEWA